MYFKAKIGEEVYIHGSDDVFIVEHTDTQSIYINFTYTKQNFYSIRSKTTGKRLEVSDNDISTKRTPSVIKQKVDELLDTYNVLMKFERIFKYGEFADKAKKVMERLKCGDY